MTREDYIKTINPDFNSHIEKGTIEMNNEYYNLLEEKIARLISQNQELKKHLKVPENCNLKTLEDYKSYYEDTTREQILEDNYIDYCAYVNLAHRYSKLKKQLEEYKEQVNKGLYNVCLPYKTGYDKAIKDKEIQQKEFIKYLEDYINSLKKEYGNYVNDNYSEEYGRYYAAKEILQKYKETIGGNKDEK